MKPEAKSQNLLNITRAKAKMWEYNVPFEYHINIPDSPEKLFPLSIALLGDVAAEINRGNENSELFKSLKNTLQFSANFFYTFDEAKLIDTLSPQLRLLASAAFYLCNMPGNANVLAKLVKYEDLSIESEGLDALLLWILQGDIFTSWEEYSSNYADFIVNLPPKISAFYKDGNTIEIEDIITNLRIKVYNFGTPEQLLLGDIISAITRKKIENASIKLLSQYTDIPIEQWRFALSKSNFIKEFWPAQHLLGEKGILKGKSAIIQIPTSAGKTKSIELILRSAFLSQRTNFAVIVAPFRALCNEIKNDLLLAFQDEDINVDALSDVLQNDFEINQILGFPSQRIVLVVTPEKLLYVLRHHPDITNNLKLVIFDEGHQFDTGKRGITYELLITSLNEFLPDNTQKVLISAVVPNAEEIGEWLNGDRNVAKGEHLSPTSKSIGFASWRDALGRIQYVENSKDTFFVPRVIEKQRLQRQGRERKDRIFPENNGQDIALFLGIKLSANGSVAIFCGRKDAAVNICKRVVEIIERSYSVANLNNISNPQELQTLTNLCIANFGAESIEAQSAKYGIFAHHNNTPHGIRIAIEYAMRNDFIHLVVCTSTLAQGVNLPIRYLVVTSFYQGKELIKVRDFHNLIGRAGRAGKYVEGSILFADTNIYDTKINNNEKWRWEKAQDLLDPNKSEKCVSSLLAIFEPIKNETQDRFIRFGENLETFENVVKKYIDNQLQELALQISQKFNNNGFSFKYVYSQLNYKRQLLESLENFLLAHWTAIKQSPEELAIELANKTLAFYLADDQRKKQIQKLFLLLAKNIADRIPTDQKKQSFGKTLYGVRTAEKIEAWVTNNQKVLLSITNIVDFIDKIWSLFCEIIESNDAGLFGKFDPKEIRRGILIAWVEGKSFVELLTMIKVARVNKINGTVRREFTVEDMVDICENTFAYEGTLVLGAVCEFMESLEGFTQQIGEQIQVYQKRLKYGLPTISAIAVYELGFADRTIAQNIAKLFPNTECDRTTALDLLKDSTLVNNDVISQYPSYYQYIFNNLPSQ
ncbi:MAG: DEAD/DEAH box helicase [Candidatus Azobacteroides sp.]|nr:DEAD/DEAH box helicase [Candidatus Azobacteroides sp.]